METSASCDPKNRKQLKRKQKMTKVEESTVQEDYLSESMRKPKDLSSANDTPLKRNKLHSKRKQMVSELLEARKVLGASNPKEKEEADLEKLIFGCNPEDLEDDEDNFMRNSTQDDSTTMPELKKKKNTLLPAWEDEDDESLLVKTKAKSLKNCHRSVSLRGEEKYSDYVQEKFIKIMGAPKWAEIGGEVYKDSDDESDELLQQTGNFIKKSVSLPKDYINIRRCPSLMDASMKASIVKSIEFHPTSKVGLVATTNGTANLFQIDGKINAKIQSIYFEDFPIETSHFTVDGREIIVGSNCLAHMFSYDMFSGKTVRIPEQKGMNQKNIRRFHMSPDGKFIVIHGRYGNIHLMTTKSKEWIGTLKMNGEVIAVTFNKDGSKMYSHGGTGEVYVWDMNSRKCIHKFVDLGCLEGTALAVSPNEQFLATGSDCGIVNVYDHKTVFTTSSPEPLKALKNLTTEITNLEFNCTSELLSMSSNRKEEALKLVHFPSLSVFSNFPTKKKGRSFKYPNSVAFSANSGYYAIGNNVGTAPIFRLKHYNNY